MRYPPPRLVALRTTPPENPHIWEEPRFQGQDTRPISHWALRKPRLAHSPRPGLYAQDDVDGQSLTKPLHIALPPARMGVTPTSKLP